MKCCSLGHVRENHYQGPGLILDQLCIEAASTEAWKSLQTNLFQRSGQFDSLLLGDLWPPKAQREVFILLVILSWTFALTFTQQLDTLDAHLAFWRRKKKKPEHWYIFIHIIHLCCSLLFNISSWEKVKWPHIYQNTACARPVVFVIVGQCQKQRLQYKYANYLIQSSLDNIASRIITH